MADETTILKTGETQIDTIEQLKKFISRKLLIWIVSSVFFATGSIGADQWFGITMTYMGVEGGADMLVRLKKKAQSVITKDETKT